jgi:SSS family solute:Na+ symporter
VDPYLYQYAVGGVVFFVGLGYAWRQGYVGTSGAGLRNLLLCFGGLFAFAAVQGYLQYAPMTEAEAVAYTGKPLEKGQLGTTLDYGIMIGYFLAMLGIGTWFGRGQTSTKDFFFGGQRFSWWLISFSLVATTIGSYSFVKYSKIAYEYGLASSQTYMNDWFWVPFLIFGWIPILYFSRVVSIPEYFARRFDSTARKLATALLLFYLVGYVGINLFTMGQALNILVGWPVFAASAGVAAISATYVTFGGQTSVIMTDLFQGVMLLATGLLILILGVDYLGGFDVFWSHLPRGHRQAFPHFNADPALPAVGVFWQDAMANSAMFYFLNQGMVMRLMAARSVKDSRRAVVTMLIVLMPIAAIVVASGGWVGKALSHAGVLPELDGAEAFFIASEFLAVPGVFGLIMAALTAALMSTVDTLITAISAIVVNDVYKPLKPEAEESELLRAARFTSVAIAVIGVALVPVFASFKSIYSAHGAFTAAVTPPLVVTLLLGVFWRRFTSKAAIATMVGGSALIFASILFPEIITPFAHGVPMKEVDPTEFLAGKNQYKFMRGFFGIVVCLGIGVTVSMFTKPKSLDEMKGLVWGTIGDAIRHYKGAEGSEAESDWAHPVAARDDALAEFRGVGQLPIVRISQALAEKLEAEVDDLVYVSDRRAWLGGLRSTHAMVAAVDASLEGERVVMGEAMWGLIVEGREEETLRVKRLY